MIRLIFVSLAILFLGFFYLWLVDNYRYGCAVCWIAYPIIGVFLAWMFEGGLKKVLKDIDF